MSRHPTTRHFLLALCLLLVPSALRAGTPDTTATRRPVTHATLFGIGGVSQLDTYLSPQTYSGPQLQLRYETFRATHLADSAVTFQSIWQANAAYTRNASAAGRCIGGDVSYDLAWHYNFRLGTRLRLLIGPQAGVNLGFLYNTRNGNNPAQALASLRLAASAAVIWHFSLWRQPFAARYQADVPLLGMKFSPRYDQSYYELFSLGNTDHNVCLTHPFNGFSSRHLLTLDIPVGRITLRTGYLCDLRQSHVNNLKYHSYTHAFMLGFVRHLNVVRARRRTPPGFIL